MVFSSLILYGLMFLFPKEKRIYHYLTITATITTAIAYYVMASQNGSTIVPIEGRGKRRIYYARYVEWLITTPLLLLDVLLLMGTDLSSIFFTIAAAAGVVISGLLGALDHSFASKWGFFAFGVLLYLYIIYILGFDVRSLANVRHEELKKLYKQIFVFFLFFWSQYGIVWALAEGGNVLPVLGEVIWYSLLDLFTKPIFALWLLFSLKRLEEQVPAVKRGEVEEGRTPEEEDPLLGSSGSGNH